MASPLGISAFRHILLMMAAAGLLLASPALAQSTRPANKPAQKQAQPAKADNASKSPSATMTRPSGRPYAIRTSRSPDADAAPSPTPGFGQVPSVAGGIPGLNASGFAPTTPIFGGLQPELPEPGPMPRSKGRGRGWDIGLDEDEDDDDDDEEEQAGNKVPEGCAKKDSGVTVWRGTCGG